MRASSSRSDKPIHRVTTDLPHLLLVLLVITLTAPPYMHNGMFATLEEVLAFYVKAEGRPAHRHPLITPLDLLTEQDQQDLLAFLRALSGTPILVVPPPLPR